MRINTLKKYALYCFAIVCLVSCNKRADYYNTLLQVESQIEENPQEALTTLQQIDTDNLSGRRTRAKYSLLYSIALDKNYIDTTEIEILQPAIAYYSKKGTPTDKLKTLYYQGRIYHNRGDEAQAMEYYLNALEKGEKSNDILTKARIYVSQGTIYNQLYEFEKLIDANLRAAELFKSAGNNESYFGCMARALNGYILNDDTIGADSCIQICKELLPIVSIKRVGDFYSTYLTHLTSEKMHSEIPLIIEEYTSAVPEEKWEYITLAYAYLEIGEYEKALTIISKHTDFSNNDHKTRYYAILSEIYENMGYYKEALENWRLYQTASGKQFLTIIEQDTQFIEERHALEMEALKKQKAKNQIILIGIIIATALVAILMVQRKHLRIKSMEKALLEKEREQYNLLYQQAEEEKDKLTDLLRENKELDEYKRGIINQRLELLNKFFASYITNNNEVSNKADKEIKEFIKNKDNFMESTRIAYTTSNPQFIKYLEEKGLTNWEICYCCLYALGLRGKEVGSYIKMRSHYNISTEIRAKLGINEHETNLGIYIRKLLKNFNS
jgi:tetratricopeptide (TPR) repeat protein